MPPTAHGCFPLYPKQRIERWSRRYSVPLTRLIITYPMKQVNINLLIYEEIYIVLYKLVADILDRPSCCRKGRCFYAQIAAITAT